MSLSVPEVKLTVAKTEYGRNKVALRPGKGLMDWIRISTGKSLAVQRLPFVSSEELMKHNKEDDCWILLFGIVYDVTKYLEYHPGGVPELMRAAGTDATELFNQYHAWVNYANMLKACVVGPFRGSHVHLPRPRDPVFDTNPALNAAANAAQLQPGTFGLCVAKPDSKTLRVRSNVGRLLPENLIVDVTEKNLRLLVRRYDVEAVELTWQGFCWSNRKFSIKAVTEKMVDIVFESEKALEEVRVLQVVVNRISGQRFHSFNVARISPVTHNTFLYCLRAPEGLHLPVPMGHHLLVKLPSGSVQRPFTPITYDYAVTESAVPEQLELFVKIYEHGKLTQCLKNLSEGDTLELSEPIGRRDIRRIVEQAHNVLLLAAGTGITPMTNIIRHRLSFTCSSEQSTSLLWFNKTEEDIADAVYADGNEGDAAGGDCTFCVEHVLSEPSAEWTGESGRVCAELVARRLRHDSVVFICGPEGFNSTAMEVLSDCGVSSDRVIVFQ